MQESALSQLIACACRCLNRLQDSKRHSAVACFIDKLRPKVWEGKLEAVDLRERQASQARVPLSFILKHIVPSPNLHNNTLTSTILTPKKTFTTTHYIPSIYRQPRLRKLSSLHPTPTTISTNHGRLHWRDSQGRPQAACWHGLARPSKRSRCWHSGSGGCILP